MRPSWSSSSNRGRGRGRGREIHMGSNNILAQLGKQRLIATNIAGTSTGISGIDDNHPMYREFMDFIQSKQQTQPSYSSIVNEEAIENVEIYDKNEIDEIVLILEPKDLQ